MNILHIDCSPRPESHSRQLSAAIVEKLLEVTPASTISRRDLGATPLPHASADYATTLSSPATLAAPVSGSLDLAEALIREVEAADVIVIGTPMHNLTVPSVLKAWIDQILRAGRTFRSTPSEKMGMLRDRPVFIGIASGGVFAGGRASQPDCGSAPKHDPGRNRRKLLICRTKCLVRRGQDRRRSCPQPNPDSVNVFNALS